MMASRKHVMAAATPNMCIMSAKNEGGAKTTAPAPVYHTGANIVSAMNTSVDIPGTSDVVNTDTDPGSQAVGEMMSSAASDGQREPVPASLEGRQPTCDAPPSHMTATSNQVCSTPNPLK